MVGETPHKLWLRSPIIWAAGVGGKKGRARQKGGQPRPRPDRAEPLNERLTDGPTRLGR